MDGPSTAQMIRLLREVEHMRPCDIARMLGVSRQRVCNALRSNDKNREYKRRWIAKKRQQEARP